MILRVFKTPAWLLIGLFNAVFFHAAAAQTPALDSALTFIEVDQLPRSDSVRAPVAAFDHRGNFAVAWVAYEKGLPQILLRCFDAIGRPLTEIRPITARNDTLLVAHPHLVFTPSGLLWMAWDQSTLRRNREVVAQILNRDFKPLNQPFPLDPAPAVAASRPRVVCDVNGNRIIAAWVRESRPAFVVARFFKTDGSPDSDIFTIDDSGDESGIGDRLDLAVSSKGIAAITWRGLGDGQDRINFRSFDNPDDFLDNKKDIAARNVAHPTLAFSDADQVILQWQAVENVAVLRAQRLDLNGEPLALPFDIAALDTGITPVVVNANEQRTFFSLWSQRDPRDRLFSQIFSQTFDLQQRPLAPIAVMARTPNFSTPGVEIESAISPAGNYLAVYAGHDRDLNSPFPRVAAVLTQAALPDLQITSLTISPENPKRADSVKVRFGVLNAGVGPAAASTALVEFINAKSDTSVLLPSLPVNGLLNVEVNMGALEPGNYTLRLTLDHTQELAELNEQNNTAGFPFKVEEAPRLIISPEVLDFTAIFGQTNPAARFLTLRNAGTDTVRWSVAVDQAWILASPSAGVITQTPGQDSARVTININTAGLLAGDFKGNLFFSSNGGNLTIPVTLTITALIPELLLQPRRFEFAATQGGSDPPPQNFTIQNQGSGTLTWNAAANQPWLSVTPDNGTTTLEIDQIAANVNIGELPPGAYSAKVFVTSNGGNDSLEVALTISPQPPALAVSPTALNFVTTEGTSNPPAQTVYIRNTGGGTLQWSVEENVNWLSISPRSGQTRANADSVRVIASISAIGPGSYSETFIINSNGGAQSVRVNFLVNPRPVFSDLRIRVQATNLEDCYTAEYLYLADFLVFNLGDGVAPPTRAVLSVNNQIVQQAGVPGLGPGETFNLLFPAQPLQTGYNTIRCEVDTAGMLNEINKTNNSVVLQEWVPQRGDANRDSVIDLRDLSHLVDLALERISAPPRREMWAANVVIDTTLNIADVVALIELLLNEGDSAPIAPALRMDLRLEKLGAAQTRLRWQTPQPLLGWQSWWRWDGAPQDHPPRSSRTGGFDVHWKVSRNVLSVLAWPVAGASSEVGASAGEIVLPFQLNGENFAAAAGLNGANEIFKLETAALEENNAPPQAFSLSPAFPNPLLRARQLLVEWRYELPFATPVEFRIFNVLGQEMRRARLGWQPAGRGHWQWDGRDERGRLLASGVYFVEFAAGNFKKRERLLLR